MFAFYKSIFDVLPYSIEYFTNIIVILCTCLQELDSIFFCQCFAFFFWYLPLSFWTVTFISYNDLRNVFWLAFVNLFKPILKTVKSFTICYRINKNNTCSTLVIGLCNGFKPLLASSIPYLHFNFDSINRNCLDLEINPDGCDACHFILFIHIAK